MSGIIIYFSRSGNNYVNGSVKSLSTGNTEIIANFISEITGAQKFRLDPLKPYSDDYMECTREARQEQNDNARPELKAYPENLDSYDIIYLGYPNWWGTMPMCVFTFLEKHDFIGKIIRPFCTHEGSGMGHSESDIRKICKGATVSKGLAIHGADSAKSRSLVEAWLQN